MRKDRYLAQFPQYLPYLRRVIVQQGLDYDDTNEVLGNFTAGMLSSKQYSSIEPQKLKAFLRTRIWYDAREFMRNKVKDKQFVTRLRAQDETDFDSSVTIRSEVVSEVEEEVEEKECPFCFQANLNQHGACAMCHTIIPSHYRAHRNVIMMTEESLAVEFDFNTKFDVEKAIARLTPYEQRIVRAIGMGNETLESFSELSARHFTTIGRDWVKAKAKLQEYLSEYAPQGVSKRGKSAFQRAVQSLEKARKLDEC